MTKLTISVIVSVKFLSIWLSFATADDRFLDLNYTRPTWPPFLKPSGLFKLVQSCENFCDGQFPPGLPGGETFKAVIGCHKGCYSFELFKVLSKKISFSMLDIICSANCKKDFFDEDFTQKFCSLGCSRMNTLYSARIKELRLEYIEQLRQQEKDKEVDSEKLSLFEQEVEKKIREQQDLAADELAVAVVLEFQKEHASVQAVHTGKHRRGLKKRIFHVERFVEESKYRPYVEIQRINTEPYGDGDVDKSDSVDSAGRDTQREEARFIMPAPPRLVKRVEQDCQTNQKLQGYIVLCFLLTAVCSAVWLICGDPMKCVCCLSGNVWEKLVMVERYLEKLDKESIDEETPRLENLDQERKAINGDLAHPIEKHVDQAVDKFDYTSPPPEKDAPPPYVEIAVLDCSGRNMEK